MINVACAFHWPPRRIVRRTEPDKRPEIDSGLLAIGVAMVNKVLEVRAGQVVPEGIQIYVGRTVVLKVGAELIVKKIRCSDGFGVVDVFLNHSPTVPAKWHSVGPWQSGGKLQIGGAIVLHRHPPIIAETDEHRRRSDEISRDAAVRHHIPRTERAAIHVHLIELVVRAVEINAAFPGAVLHRANYQTVARGVVVECCDIVAVTAITDRYRVVTNKVVIVERHTKGAIVVCHTQVHATWAIHYHRT